MHTSLHLRRFIWLAALVLLTACAESPAGFLKRMYGGGVMPPPREATSTFPGGPPPVPSATAEVPGQARPIKVALLLPLSGESASLGQPLLDAAVLALFDKYATLSPREITARVVLLPKDTAGSPTLAAKAATSAMDEGAQLIIGPLFSQEVKTVAPLAAVRGVPMISFSNNKVVAGKGVYIIGFMPEQQVRRVADYIFDRGAKRIAALIPSDPYGSAVAKELTETAKRRGAVITPTEFYPASASSFVTPAARIMKTLSGLNEPEQALFIAEGGERLRDLTAELVKNKFSPARVRLLGTGKWDDSDLLRSPNLVGGWFASAPLKRYQSYAQRFYNSYGYRPPRLASLAYDAVALTATLSLVSGGPDFSPAGMTNPAGFVGPANGIFRFDTDGVCERGLEVLEVTPSGFRTLDPAPEAFR